MNKKASLFVKNRGGGGMPPLRKNESPNSENIYTAIFDRIGSPILIIDSQTAMILDVNVAACKFYGYPHEDFVQKRILDLAVLPVQEAWQRIQKIAAGEITHMTLQHRLASGEIRDVEVELGIENFGETRVNIATVHDITEREQAKKKLQESEKNYRLLFQNMREGFSLYEVINDEAGHPADARILAANAAYENHTGLKPEDVIGKTILEVMPQTTLEQLDSYFKVAQTGELFSQKYFSTVFQRHFHTTTFCPQPSQFATIVEDITERKQAEDALRESEARFSTIFHTSHDAISIARLSDDVYLDVNEAFCNTFGVARDQAVGHTGRELNIAADPAQREEVIRRLRSQGRIANFETEFHNHVGKTGFLLLSGKIIKIAGQEFLVIFGKDITDRKQTEAALQSARDELEVRVQERTRELLESEKRFRALFEKNAVVTLLIAPDTGNILNVNLAAANFYGYSQEQLCSMNINEINQLNRKEVLKEMQLAADKKRNFFIFRHRLANGQLRTVEVHSNPIDMGQSSLLLSFVYDITEKIELERKLNENQFRTEMAIFGANEGTWEWNIQTGETIFNERWAQIIGYSLKELEPISIQTWIDLCHPDDLKASNEQLQIHFSGKSEFYDCEVRMRHKDGYWIWVSDRGKVMNWTEDGKPLHMFGTHVDITERKQAETKLIETNIALNKAVHSRDEFMAAMNHELRTPLGGIMGMTELLKITAADALTPRQLNYIDAIETSGQRLLDMISKVLEFTQLQGGALKPVYQPCRLGETCRLAIQNIMPLAANKLQGVHFSIQPSEITIHTDEHYLQKVISLLFDNAIKFTPDQGNFGLEITGREDAGQVDINVWDTGIGIAEENLPRLFHPFVQLDSSLARKYEGAGLSLALVKSITEMLGGTVSVQSTLGEGSRFIVTLPWK